MNPALVFDVVRFELARSLTIGRTAIWVILVMFPVGLIAMLRFLDPGDQPEPWGIILYFLVPEVVCLLGLLLWATPVISTEIEGQTWIYLAMRRSGRSMVLLGKYLTAVLWTLSAALVSTGVCIAIMGPLGGFRLWGVMSALAVLSCITHGALYLLIGLIFYRRTMVTAVLYTLLFEYGLSLIPALANKLTINYRLRGLLATWMDWQEARSQAENVFGSEPASTHLLVLFAMTITMIGAALFRLGHSEFPTQQEG
jgi:ABC-type transport system involved in multi-copper enzyme maturation permease subunit